jgi:hypothetical protein
LRRIINDIAEPQPGPFVTWIKPERTGQQAGCNAPLTTTSGGNTTLD